MSTEAASRRTADRVHEGALRPVRVLAHPDSTGKHLIVHVLKLPEVVNNKPAGAETLQNLRLKSNFPDHPLKKVTGWRDLKFVFPGTLDGRLVGYLRWDDHYKRRGPQGSAVARSSKG